MPERESILGFVDKTLQPLARPRVAEYVEKRRTSGPLIVEFDPTTSCNFHCPECISAGLLNQGQIAKDRLPNLIDELQKAGVKGVIFIGGGEPLAHTSMPDPIIQANNLGMSVGLTTNGSLIDKYLSAIAEHVSWTRVSVDAGTEETFSRFRPSGILKAFDKVIGNMEQLSRIKTGLLGYSFLMMERNRNDESQRETNCNEIIDAAVIAKDIGCDYFEFKPMVDEHHNLVSFSDATKRSLEKQLPRLNDLNTDSFKVIFPQSIPHLLDLTSPDQPKDYETCPTLELRTVVNPKGIYACPYKRGYEDAKIGEIDIPFDDFWKTDERFRNAQKVNPSKDCKFFCIRDQTNVLLHTLAAANEKGINLLPYMVQTVGQDIFL